MASSRMSLPTCRGAKVVTTDYPIFELFLYFNNRLRYLLDSCKLDLSELTIFLHIPLLFITSNMSSAQSRLSSVMGHLNSPADGKARLLERNPDDIVGYLVACSLIMLLH